MIRLEAGVAAVCVGLEVVDFDVTGLSLLCVGQLFGEHSNSNVSKLVHKPRLFANWQRVWS